ncbi:hypothetical protein ACFQU3_13935 [Terrabacter sp. GCM10028922]|uniref:hypothetical protein n=1 Tax=Terrabacter sp. GCM10028922 TaxID=3273428 RepID=UPI003618729F
MTTRDIQARESRQMTGRHCHSIYPAAMSNGRRSLVIAAGVFLVSYIIVLAWAARSDVELFMAVATALSAIGSCAAAIVVAAQTYFTRRAVEETAAATIVSKRMMGEAVKARLDARAPHITVTRAQDILWPPYEPSDFGEAQPLPPGHEYHLPRDGSSRIQARLHLSITNHASWPVTLLLEGIVPAGWNEQKAPPAAAEVSPNASEDFFALATRTVAEWVMIAEGRRAGDPGPETAASVTYVEDDDEAVMDRWDVLIGGTPLTPVPQQDGLWRLSDGPRSDLSGHSAIDGLVQIKRREYFLSRRNNLKLDS